MLHAGIVEMLVKEHFQLAVGCFAAGAGIVPRQCQRAGKHIHRHEHRQRRRHPRTDMAAHLFHQLQHQRVAVAHPHHRRNAPEKAVQQVDAPAQIELELAVIPEHGTEQ